MKARFGRNRSFLFCFVFALASVTIAYADSSHHGSDKKVEQAVTELIHCYARGTDQIGAATTNTDPLAAGIAEYRKCFRDDAQFQVWFPHQAFNSQTFPDALATPPTATADGFVAWAEFVDGVFRGNGYDFTQHIISNIDVDVRGRRAKLTAYLNASHIISGDGVGGVSRCVAVANGTYSIKAVKHRGKWRAKSLDLTLVSFNPIFESDTGCTPP